MILPILTSVSVAPGSYFFCADALLASAVASKVAIAMDLAWLKALLGIVVLPDVWADGSNSLVEGCFDEPSDQCHLSMHDRGVVTSDGIAADLPWNGKSDRSRRRERSNSDQTT